MSRIEDAIKAENLILRLKNSRLIIAKDIGHVGIIRLNNEDAQSIADIDYGVAVAVREPQPPRIAVDIADLLNKNNLAVHVTYIPVEKIRAHNTAT